VAKKRVNALARELGITSKEALEYLHRAGLEVKTHSSNVDEEVARGILLKALGKTPVPGPTAPVSPVPPVVAEEVPSKAIPSGRLGEAVPPPKVRRPREIPGREEVPVSVEMPSAAPGVLVEAPPAEVKPTAPAPPAPEAKPVVQPVPPSPVKAEPIASPPPGPTIEVPRKPILRISEAVTVKELAEKLQVSGSEVIKRLMKMGVMATINQSIDPGVAKRVADQFGVEVEVTPLEEFLEIPEEVEEPEKLRSRAPVVTIMGHVDHGKTTLLDAIRQTNVTASEVGGITQHIGAYEVELPPDPSKGFQGGKIVFLDTPGHEAFTAMRARGAQVTDLVVLVVAADDGVMPQTVEAINHAKAAGVPIMVAVNKIDKPNADPNRVKQQLADLGLVPEEWGGQTIFVEVSAKKRIGIENLLEMLLLLAEIQELKANPFRTARGTVIEAKLDKGRGPVATVLIQQGTLRVGDAFVAGFQHGKVRALINDKGRRMHEAGPSTPVEVLGFSDVPVAGDLFIAVSDERKARQIALARRQKHREEVLAAAQRPRLTLEDLHRRVREGEIRELRLIIKGDVQGSVEALRDALERLSTETVKLRILHSAVGAVSESDVMLASASDAVIIGFGVRADPQAQRLAEVEHVEIRLYNVIYDAVAEVKAAMEGLLEPTYKERVIGRVEVRALFQVPKVGTVAGGYVLDGKVVRDASIRLVRDGKVVHEGRIASLKRFKEDVREVGSGYECGVGLLNFSDIKVGDIIEVYELEAVAPKL